MSARRASRSASLWWGPLALLLVACEGESGSSWLRPPLPPAANVPLGSTVETAERVRARVARVRDGDSLVVSFPDGSGRDVRLHAIDAPEAGQAWGRESGEHLRRLALGREVDLHLRGIDGYGRHLAVAIVAEGDLGLLQIRGGHAWHYRRYADEQESAVRERYTAAERAARAERLGLWAAAAPSAPWDFKSERRAGARPPAEGAPTRADGVVGNRRSRLYHLPGCPGHAAVAPGNVVPFESEAAAREAGFQRAANCRPPATGQQP